MPIDADSSGRVEDVWSVASMGNSSDSSASSNVSQEGLVLKPLPNHLRYAFLGDNSTFAVNILASLDNLEEEKLLGVLRKYKSALGWTIADIKGISPSTCLYKILMEDSYKPSIEHQRRLNQAM